jgi:hypothetical protein
MHRVWLGVAVEGVDVGDTGDVDDGRGGTATASIAATDHAAREGHDELTSETRHIWGLSELDSLLLSPYPDITHATREVSEDLMLEEVAASFAAISASICANSTMVSHPTQLAADSVPLPLQDSQSQATPPQATQTTSGATRLRTMRCAVRLTLVRPSLRRLQTCSVRRLGRTAQ